MCDAPISRATFDAAQGEASQRPRVWGIDSFQAIVLRPVCPDCRVPCQVLMWGGPS
jgi:hypothetical protein